MKQRLQAVFILIFTSPIDYPLMLIGGELWPHKPDLKQISHGSWYHKAKGYWAESFRTDGEWWSKLSRFIIWWQVAIIIGMAT